MVVRVSKQQLNTSNKQHETNGNFVGNPVFIKDEIIVLSSSMKLGLGHGWVFFAGSVVTAVTRLVPTKR